MFELAQLLVENHILQLLTDVKQCCLLLIIHHQKTNDENQCQVKRLFNKQDHNFRCAEEEEEEEEGMTSDHVANNITTARDRSRTKLTIVLTSVG